MAFLAAVLIRFIVGICFWQNAAASSVSMEALIAYLANSTQVGQHITLTVLRNGAEQELETELQARPNETAQAEENQRELAPRAAGAWLGIDAVSLDAALAEAAGLDADQQGVLVIAAAQGGPADEAGLRGGTETVEIDGRPAIIGGDVIVAIDGDEIASLEELVSWLSQAEPGDEVTLTILRAGRQMELPVTLGQRPA